MVKYHTFPIPVLFDVIEIYLLFSVRIPFPRSVFFTLLVTWVRVSCKFRRSTRYKTNQYDPQNDVRFRNLLFFFLTYSSISRVRRGLIVAAVYFTRDTRRFKNLCLKATKFNDERRKNISIKSSFRLAAQYYRQSLIFHAT